MGAVLCALALFVTVSVVAFSMTASFADRSASNTNKTVCRVAVLSACDMICDVLTMETEPHEGDIRTYIKDQIGEGALRDGGGEWERHKPSEKENDDSVRTFSMSISDSSPEVFFDIYWECPNFSEKEIPNMILTVSVYSSYKNESCREELRFVRQTEGIYNDDYRDSDNDWRWCLHE